MKYLDRETGEFVEFEFRTAHNYNTDEVSRSSGLKCEDESLTQQQFKDEVDINNLMEKFGITGQIPPDTREPSYEDYSDVNDFQTAMQQVRLAEQEFMEIPAKVRARFNNNPQEYLEFFQNGENYEEGVKLGIINKRPLPKPEGLESPRTRERAREDDKPSGQDSADTRREQRRRDGDDK